ncbi:AAA family ATPase [Micromonospora sp. R77]|uniref:ATP-binding protein n=1 Tax=Micromonospora sp. R77 TaxID=2925836 RepID=UPI001F606F44|nr:LuxR family transcriptional regulator [Micromonospora sp. R77]MCI4066308.1 AAA family ATPase [Micromonospora sp. R77]
MLRDVEFLDMGAGHVGINRRGAGSCSVRSFDTSRPQRSAAMIGGPSAPGLVGRGAELAELADFLRTAAESGGVELVTGDPGVGKSSLLEAAVRAAAATTGFRVLRASGVEFEADLGYAGLHQLLLPVADAIDELPDRHGATLRAALGLGSEGTPDLLGLTTATVALLGHLSRDRPLLIVVDDLQWVDRASLLLLSVVARRLNGFAVALLLAQRSGHETFFDRASIPTLELSPLSDDDADALLRVSHPNLLHPSVRKRIVAEAGGNPLALIELPRGLTATQETAVDTLPATLPHSVRLRRLFASRIAELPESCRRLLLLAALHHGDDAELVQIVAGSSADLAPCEVAGLVSIQPDPRRVRFSHPLVRAAVVDQATDPERRAAHRRLAELTHDRHVRALHLADSTLGTDDHIAGLLDGVADAALSRGAADRAVAVLLRAADLTSGGPARARRLAAAAYLGANVTGSLAGASALLARARSADPDATETLQMATAAAAHLLNTDGGVETAHRMLTRALAPSPTEPGSRTTGLHECPFCRQPFADADDLRHHLEGVVNNAVHTLMVVCAFGGREDLWSGFTETVTRLAPWLSPVLRLAATTFADPARATPGQLAELDGLVAAADKSTNPVEVLEVAMAGQYVDRTPAAALDRVVQAGRAGGPATLAAQALLMQATTAVHEGRWADAAALVDEGLALCAQHDLRLLEWGLLIPRMILDAARGDIDDLARVRDRMHQWALPRQMLAARTVTANADGLAALSVGRFVEAYTAYCTIAEPGRLRPYAHVLVGNPLDVVEAAVRSGHLDEARRHAAVMASTLAPISPRLAFQSAAAAALAAPVEDYAEVFDRVVDDPDSARWPFHLARVELAYGERLRVDRAMRRARPHLERACELFHALEASPWVERAEAGLRATGRTRLAASADTATRLTPQEAQVAFLAATGLSNREIGERLTLSPRTVGAHLYRVFPKLGVTSRAGLRDALSGHEDTP